MSESLDQVHRAMLECAKVSTHIRTLSSPFSSETERLLAAKTVAQASFDWHCSRLPRGRKDRGAAAGMDGASLSNVYRIFVQSNGEVRFHILRVIANVGDEGFVQVAKHHAQKVNDATYSLMVYAVGQIGGPEAYAWLKDELKIESSARQPSIRLALTAIEEGAIEDYAEGLISPEPIKGGELPEARRYEPRMTKAALFGGAVDKIHTTEYQSMISKLADGIVTT